ncbi:MAG: methylmalonyl-CoA mutase family protein, partial [Halobacteriaceae archaeon]
IQAALDAGLAVDDFAPQLSFFFNAHNNIFEEVAKFRAARRMWAKIMEDRFGAEDPASKQLKFHTQTAGSTLTAQQIENNIVRVSYQALAAVLGGTQSLHTNGKDEALSIPTEESVRTALRTQQILAYESGAADTIDPLAGSYYVEDLTNKIESDAFEIIDQIDQRGGMLDAVDQQWVQRQIQDVAYSRQ